MKKFLSLVLALVMTMSLVTISAGATFTDDSKVGYDEAVDVISALDIVGGYPDGSFRPQATLTRGAAAKIICNMMLGVKTASELPAVASYKDVPADSTFAPYIAYLKNEGVVGGYADGTFRPGNTLTGYHFLKMLLGAMGYDAKFEGLEGDGWQINVAKLAKAAGLYDGNDDFNGNKAATREEACLYAFNTLTGKTVKYDNKSSVTIGDIVISNNSKAEEDGWFYKNNFDTLVLDDSLVDAQGRPAKTWKYGKSAETIGYYGEDADYTFTVSSDWDGTPSHLTEMQKATDNKKLANAATPNVYFVNDDTAGTIATIPSGSDVELYVNDTTNVVEKVIVTTYELAEITKVDTNITNKQDIEDGVTAKVTFKTSTGSKTYKDTVFAGFDADTYVKGAKVLVALANTGINTVDNVNKDIVVASQIAETVTGEVTSLVGSKATIGGKSYSIVSGSITASDIGKTVTVVLNKAGKIIDVDKVGNGEIADYMYIYAVKTETKTNDDGVDAATYTAYGVTAEGTKVSYKVTDEDSINRIFYAHNQDISDPTVGFDGYQVVADADGKYAPNGTVIPYSIDDGKLVVESGAAGWAVWQGTTALGKNGSTVNAKVSNGGTGYYYASADTQFVFKSVKSDNTVKVTTAVGYKNVNLAADQFYMVVDDTDIKLVFAFVSDSATTTDNYVLGAVLDDTKTTTKEGTTTYTSVTVMVDGAEKTLTTTTASNFSGLEKGGVYKFTLNNKGEVDSAATELVKVEIEKAASNGESFISKVNSFVYDVDADATVYTVYENWKSTGGVVELDNYTIASDTALVEDDVLVHVYKDKNDNYTYFFHKSNEEDFT